MGVSRPPEGHLRVPRSSTRMSHPLAGAHNHGGGGNLGPYLRGQDFLPSPMGSHAAQEKSTYTFSFMLIGKNPFLYQDFVWGFAALIQNEKMTTEKGCE